MVALPAICDVKGILREQGLAESDKATLIRGFPNPDVS